MKITASLQGVIRLFLDTAPVIYYIENHNTQFQLIDSDIAQQAAQLRSRYNLSLLDAYQVSVAIKTNCQAFLTNDIALKRVTELRIFVLDELEP